MNVIFYGYLDVNKQNWQWLFFKSVVHTWIQNYASAILYQVNILYGFISTLKMCKSTLSKVCFILIINLHTNFYRAIRIYNFNETTYRFRDSVLAILYCIQMTCSVSKFTILSFGAVVGIPRSTHKCYCACMVLNFN